MILRSVWFIAFSQNKVPYWALTNALPHPRRLISLLRHHDCWRFVFWAVKIRLGKETIFKRESEQIILHWRLAIKIAQYWFTHGVQYGNKFDGASTIKPVPVQKTSVWWCPCFGVYSLQHLQLNKLKNCQQDRYHAYRQKTLLGYEFRKGCFQSKLLLF